MKVTPLDLGWKVQFLSVVSDEDIKSFNLQLRNELAGSAGSFVLVIDLQEFKYFTADAQASLEETLEDFKSEGLIRVGVLAFSTAFAALFCDIMVRIDMMPLYRYFDISYEENWEAELEEYVEKPFIEEEQEGE